MGLSFPCTKSLVIIAFNPVKKLGINPMVHSAPWYNPLVIIPLYTVNNNL